MKFTTNKKSTDQEFLFSLWINISSKVNNKDNRTASICCSSEFIVDFAQAFDLASCNPRYDHPLVKNFYSRGNYQTYFFPKFHCNALNLFGNSNILTPLLTKPFSTNVSLLYPLKTENRRFSDVFRGYRSGKLVGNGLNEHWRVWDPIKHYYCKKTPS